MRFCYRMAAAVIPCWGPRTADVGTFQKGPDAPKTRSDRAAREIRAGQLGSEVQVRVSKAGRAAPRRVGWSHWGWVDVDGQRKLMQVVTTLDGAVVKTVNLNRNALKAMRKGNQEWFSDRCLEPPIWRNDDGASSEQV